MKKTIVSCFLILITVLVFISCDPATISADEDGSSPDDDSESLPADGKITVNLTGASAIDSEYLYAYVYADGETDINTPTSVLACSNGQISSGTVSITLKVDDDNWGPTSTDWTGAGGVTYDLYIYTDDAGNNPDVGDYMATPLPMDTTIDGDQSVDILFGDMVPYSAP